MVIGLNVNGMRFIFEANVGDLVFTGDCDGSKDGWAGGRSQ